MAEDRSFALGDPVRRRTVVAGVAGLGLAGLLGIGAARAQQDLDDDPEDVDDVLDDDVEDTEDAAEETARGEAYQNFLGKLTTNLSLTDSTEVDLAIRDALKAMVEETFAAGDISRNNADALKERIDTSVAPLGVFGMGHRIRDRRERRSGSDASGGASDATPATDDGTSPTPTA